MATYRKRGDVWRAEIAKNNIRESRTFSTKREAQEWAARRELEITTARSGKVIRWTLADVAKRYAEEISVTKAGYRWESVRIATLCRHPIAEQVMQDIQASDLAAWRDERLQEVQSASVLRDINLLRAIWRQAIRGEWHYVDHNPWAEVTKPADSRARTVTFTDEQIERIVTASGYDVSGPPTSTRQEAIVALLLSLETAMRAGEMIKLTWDNVDLDKRVAHLESTKNGDSRDVPLSSKAMGLLQNMRGRHQTRVFSLSSQLLDAYYRQCRDAAGVSGVRLHDARATAITRLSKKLDILELARMSGHRDPRSLMVYYRKSAAEIAQKLD